MPPSDARGFGAERAIFLVGGLYFLLVGVDMVASSAIFLLEISPANLGFNANPFTTASQGVNLLVGLAFLVVGILLLTWSRRSSASPPWPPPPGPPVG